MALDRTKCDPVLGKKIHAFLVENKVETPLKKVLLNEEQKLKKLKNITLDLLKTMGLDVSNDSIEETPSRFAKMLMYETLWGLDYNNFPKIMTVQNSMNYNNLVIERKINVVSQCEHHLVPILGKAHVAYIPNNKVLGLSKLNRVVEFFSRRPQVQERLVEQIYFALKFILETDSIAVTIVADHMCVKSRGVEDHESDTVTTKLGGSFFSDLTVRNEYYQALNLK